MGFLEAPPHLPEADSLEAPWNQSAFEGNAHHPF
jgi:hypothetical protein